MTCVRRTRDSVSGRFVEPKSTPESMESYQATWMRPGCPESEQWAIVRQALKRQKQLERSIAFLHETASRKGPLPEPLQHLVNATSGLSGFFHAFLKPVFYNELPSLAATEEPSKAQEALHIPEILELVLEHVSGLDILHFQQITRKAHAIVRGSPRLQARLSLRADAKGSHLRTPFGSDDFPGFKCEVRSVDTRAHRACHGEHGSGCAIIAAQFASARPLPEVGPRCRKMFIVQPPIHEIQVHMACCARRPNEEAGQDTLRSATGLTVGDLLDASAKLREEHRACPHAPFHMHGTDGFVDVLPMFRADLLLRPNDPLVLNAPSNQAETTPEAPEVARLREYVKYKHEAYARGEYIQPLAEWEVQIRATAAGPPSPSGSSSSASSSSSESSRRRRTATANPRRDGGRR